MLLVVALAALFLWLGLFGALLNCLGFFLGSATDRMARTRGVVVAKGGDSKPVVRVERAPVAQ